MNDFFHKYGKTLILAFEQGEKEYDEAALEEKKTSVEYYDGEADIRSFCLDKIGTHHPDRIYVEMNAMIPGLREQFPEIMHVAVSVCWFDWATLPLYFVNFRQMIQVMVSQSQQITFRDCPSKELLAPYSEAFRLMNHRASYLRQDPMGYHEKAFDLFLPFSLEENEITVTEDAYLPFWLDASDHPEHYDGKTLCFPDPLELRRIGNDGPFSSAKTGQNGILSAGRVVMTCCMADLQFMSFELVSESAGPGHDGTADAGHTPEGWVTFDALAKTGTGEYGRRILKLAPIRMTSARPPAELILKP